MVNLFPKYNKLSRLKRCSKFEHISIDILFPLSIIDFICNITNLFKLFIENSDGTEEIPENVIGVILNQDLSQLSHISIRVRQHGAVFCCVLDNKVFKDFINKFKNKDLVYIECLDERKINIKKIEKLEKVIKEQKNKNIIHNQSNEINEIKKEKPIEEEKGKETLIYSVKDKEVFIFFKHNLNRLNKFLK